MTLQPPDTRVAELRARLTQVRTELRAAMLAAGPEEVADYVFQTPTGEVRFSALFGDKRDLMVIHNMGTKCAYCTLWADGYNGIYPHLANRAAFVLTSPDPPEQQAAFARSRGWRFPMVSHRETRFAADMGFADGNGKYFPGISAFQMRGTKILRVAASNSEPYDQYCAAWHLFDLLPEGADGWSPKFNYG